MSVKVFPIDFIGQGALLQPKDEQLHAMALDFCKRELVGGEVNLSKFNRVWVAAEVDEGGKPIEILGITGWVYRVDIPVFRALNSAATAKLHQRLHTYFADQGCLGTMDGSVETTEVFIHLSSKETPEQRCANWSEELAAAGAVPADRFIVKVAAK